MFRLAICISLLAFSSAASHASAAEIHVIDGRYYAPVIAWFTYDATSKSFITEAPIGNFQSASWAAHLAHEFGQYAAATAYEDESQRAQATNDYLYWRYWQLYYSYQAATNFYYGLFEEPFGPLYSYDDIRIPFEYSMYAYYYGLADFYEG